MIYKGKEKNIVKFIEPVQNSFKYKFFNKNVHKIFPPCHLAFFPISGFARDGKNYQ